MVLAAGEPAETAARYLSPAAREQLPAAAAGIAAALAPAAADELVSALTRSLSLIAGALGQDARTEWIAAAYDELKTLPRDLVLEALANARRHCDHMSKIVPFVEQAVARPLAERRTQAKLIEQLRAAAEAPPAVEPTAEEQAALAADIEALLAKLRAKRADEVPAADASPEEKRRYREMRPAYDADAHEQRTLDVTNFARRMRGEPPLTVEQLREQQGARLRDALRGGRANLDALGDEPPARQRRRRRQAKA